MIEDPAASPEVSTTPTATDFVGLYVETNIEIHGEKPYPRWTGQMARHLSEAVKAKMDPDTIRSAIRLMVERTVEPKDWASVYMEAQASRGPTGSDRDLIKILMEENDGKWPTGARSVRGTHSSNLVWDPLGYEPIPSWYDLHGSGIHRPTRDEVLAALKEQTHDDG